ncbi:hypothetical protein F5X68DRAFT_278525 [Plectosphaerella plurivora]|uniref:DUF3074 domain-containing protein n=1 Tax=Plectosphaerella plurivora TaxID=936078 RepID=A0A9P8V4H3_9PEZI|nr:hypothetical protein F5X68DRAFT_278525 [Plectosphaerella plurivora]
MATPLDRPLGPLVRLWGLTTAQLPPTNAGPAEIAPFVTALLRESIPFTDSISPKDGRQPSASGWVQKPKKTYPESAAPVEVFERVVSPSSLEEIISREKVARPEKLTPETWACRRSVHVDAATTGSASWAEFIRCYKEAHREAEDAFTPEVVASRDAASWDCGDLEVEIDGEVWSELQMTVCEVRHKIAPAGLLNDRVFGVLMLSAALKGADEFVVLSVSINDLATSPLGSLAKEKGAVFGAYTSVERVRKVGDGIEWIMATASDAKGVLPVWVQAKAVTGLIAKDVPMFLGWVAKERAKAEEERVVFLRNMP